jgi:hypothetical protein
LSQIPPQLNQQVTGQFRMPQLGATAIENVRYSR